MKKVNLTIILLLVSVINCMADARVHWDEPASQGDMAFAWWLIWLGFIYLVAKEKK